MSNKAKRDEAKRIASVLLAKGYLPEEIANKQVAAQAWKRFERNARLSIDSAIRREERSRRSIARRATRKALAEALCDA